MVLNENEVSVCLEYGINVFLKDDLLKIKEMHLKITDKIEVNASVLYQGNTLDLEGEFTINYCQGKIGFENIKGKIEYLFLTMNIMNVFKRLVHDQRFICQEDACYYVCDLPIENLFIENEHVCVQLKERL